jgi:hypothetical protein
MPQGRLEAINQQGAFYKNNFRLLLNVAYVLIGLCALLTLFIWYQYLTKPAPHYFATTIDGRLVEIFPK